MNILITGSRNASPKMLATVGTVLDTVKANDCIIVGDAEGVDARVIQECDKRKIKVYVCGAYDKLRRRTTTGKNITFSGDYPDRDRKMAQLADSCYAIWDGQSRGTQITANAAKALGKPTQVLTPDQP